MTHRILSVSESWRNLLINGEETALPWTESLDRRAILLCLITIIGGVGIYGATIGLWHEPKQALFVAIKLPLIILTTLLVNGMINGMLAQLLGSQLTFAQTTLAILTAFTVFALIVGSLAPITWGMTLDAPSPDSPQGEATHRRLLLTHTSIIAGAGLISTWRLHRLLIHFTRDAQAAQHCLLALLAGNLFAGAQVSYLLRPIFGQPSLAIQFLRPDPFEGNFYESILWALTHTF